MEEVILLKQYRGKSGKRFFNYKLLGGEESFISMINNSIKDFPKGKIRVSLLHEDIFKKHSRWPFTTYDNISFIETKEKIIKYGEDLNEVIFEILVIPVEWLDPHCYLCAKEDKISPHYKRGTCKECFDNLPNILYPTGFKKCSNCKIEKSINDYYFDKRKNLPRYICKSCQKIKR